MARKSFKIGKLNTKGMLTRAAVIAVTGAASQIVATLVEGEVDATTTRPKNAEIVDYAMIGAGIILPEVMKGNAMVADASSALLAVGAYRMAVANDLSGKIGVNSIASANDVKMIGNQTWIPQRKNGNGEGTNKQKRGDAAMVL